MIATEASQGCCCFSPDWTTAAFYMRASKEQQTYPVWIKFLLIPPLPFPWSLYSPYVALASSEMGGVVRTEVCKVSELSVGQVLFLKKNHFCCLLIKNKYEVHKQNQFVEALRVGEIPVNIFSISNSLVLQDTNKMVHPCTGIYFSLSDPEDPSFQPHPLVMPLCSFVLLIQPHCLSRHWSSISVSPIPS